QAFAHIWSRIAGRVEPSNDTGDAQPSQNMAKDHRSNDIAAARVEKDNAPKLLVRTAGLEEIDKGLWRLGLNHAVGHDDVGTMPTAFAGFERGDAEGHRRPVLLGESRRQRAPREP